LGLVAQALAGCTEAHQRLAAIDEAIATVETTEERYYLAELNRVRAELLLLSEPSKILEAERCFRVSIDIAREQHARCWEQRATADLVELLAKLRRGKEGRTPLAHIYN